MNWRSLCLSASSAADALRRATRGMDGAAAKRRVPAGLCVLVAVMVAPSLPACSSTTPVAASGTGPGSGGGSSTTTPPATNACANPSPGCPCSSDAQTAPCGKVILRTGDFFQCEEGTTTCNGKTGTWGACDGSIKTSANAISGGGVSIQGLGAAMACGASNPCDPYCQINVDTPKGVDGGAGISTATDAGLEIALPNNINTCNEPATPASVYSALTATDKGNPTACTSGASDNCNSDYACTSGTCAPYGDGVVNAATACKTKPDFTVGLGCWDTAAQPLELEVCNRGGVAAVGGNLPVVIESGSPGFAAGSCPVNSNLATTPVPTSGTASGTCIIPLAQVPIGPGECISFNVDAPPTPITCKTSAGTGVISEAGPNLFAVVNPSTVVLPGGTPLSECDACNNYTAFNTSAASRAAPAGQCVSSWCGYKAGADGTGSSCSTTISGQVTDPAGNVGLSNVEVYLPTGAPIALPDEPANTSATPESTTPTCDTCAALRTPFSVGTVTDVHGNFTLPVTPGTFTLIAQIGRWRRIITVTANACTNNVLPSVVALPANRTQGDIPKMALVMGGEESLECWLVKVGISSSEIAPYTGSTNANRVQLYSAGGQKTVTGFAPSTYPSTAATFGNLWDNGTATTLNTYSSVLVPCDGNPSEVGTATALANVTAYSNAGGRIFMDHVAGEPWIQQNPAWSATAVATWVPALSGVSPFAPAQGKVLDTTGSTDQQAMYDWVTEEASVYNPNVNSIYGTGYIQSSTPRSIAVATGADSLELIAGDNSAAQWPGGIAINPYVLSFWFNTPITQTPGNYCGRNVFNDMHVSPTRGAMSCSFPGACIFPTNCDTTTPLSPEELALEYEFFQLSSCSLGVTSTLTAPTPPAPPTPLTSQTFIRQFRASCPANFGVKWGFFEWEANVPVNTSIVFTTATAPDGPGATPGTYGTTIPLATATNTNSSPTSLTKSGSVDSDLIAAGQTSQQWLEVKMQLNPDPTGEITPQLVTWQQLYDCTP